MAQALDAMLGRRNDIVTALAGQVGQLHPHGATSRPSARSLIPTASPDSP